MSRSYGSLIHKGAARAIIVLLIASSLPPMLQAQLSKGSVTGTVVDQQDARMSGVQVTLTNQQTGIAEPKETNDNGVFKILADPGIYTITFMRDGFETQKFENLEVQASKDSTVNVGLKIGSVSSEISVISVNGTELDKSSATVRLNLPGRFIDEFPMGTSTLVPGGSRNFARFPLFTPGIARVLFQNETSANGHRGRENNYMIDGTDNNDQTVTLPALFIPPEAIQEVDVQAATFSAEYGRNIGAQVNVITKRGTNSYRGQLWEFYRGNGLEPLALTDIKGGLKTPPRLVDHQFGGALGGPAIRNKTFFFGMVQGNLLRTGPRALTPVTIPTEAGYAALLTAPLRSTPTAQSAASRQAMLDTLSFLPGIYASGRPINPLATPVSVNGTSVELGTTSSVIPTRQNIWYTALRVDHQLTPNDRLAFRSHIDRRNSPLSSGNLIFGERWGADTKYFGQNHFISHTKNIGSHFVNEARLAYTRLYPSIQERDTVSPTINITNNFQIGGSSNFPQDRLEQTWQLQNVSTYLVSRHTLKFGLDLARTKLVSNNGQHLKGTWTFQNLQSLMNNQATTLQFLAGAPSKYEFQQLRQAYFFQDDFRLTPNLTTNIGLRYETSAVPLGFFGATDPQVLSAGVPGPVKRDTNNWGPRVGFAYSPTSNSGLLGTLFGDGKSSIRGGFGIGYDVLFYSLLASPAGNYPRNDLQTYTGTTAPAADQFPVLPPRITTPAFSATGGYVNLPSDSQNPTSHYWTLSIQRQLHKDYTVEIGYNGNRSYHLIRQSHNNPGILSAAQAATVIATCTANPALMPGCQDPAPSRLNPAWGVRQSLETTGEASYNGAYVQLSGRTNFGLRFGANYTWSTNLSDSEEFSNDSGSTDGGLASSSPQVPQDFLNRRNEWSRSVFDRPHRATFNYNYDIPWFRSGPVVLERIFSGFRLSGFTELQSGQPFTIKTGVDSLGNLVVTSARPDYNPAGIISLDPVTGNFRTFVTPLDGTGIVTAPHITDASGTKVFLKNSMPGGGNLGRNTFRGPGYANFNMSISKRIGLAGDRVLQIRGDFINVFNHDNFPNPDANMSSLTFGRQVFRPLTDARQVLLGAKLSF
jgi:hypothetical protein